LKNCISSLHFNDNAQTPNDQSSDHDKLYKIGPILDYLNQRCLSVPMSERLSIDEQMCATKARHHMKMYMKDKPVAPTPTFKRSSFHLPFRAPLATAGWTMPES
jgi:hypothetical protein